MMVALLCALCVVIGLIAGIGISEEIWRKDVRECASTGKPLTFMSFRFRVIDLNEIGGQMDTNNEQDNVEDRIHQHMMLEALRTTEFLHVSDDGALASGFLSKDEALALAKELGDRKMYPKFSWQMVKELGPWTKLNQDRVKRDIPRFIRYVALCQRHGQAPLSFIDNAAMKRIKSPGEIEAEEQENYDAMRIGAYLAQTAGGNDKATIAVLIGTTVAAMGAGRIGFSFEAFKTLLDYVANSLSHGGTYADISKRVDAALEEAGLL